MPEADKLVDVKAYLDAVAGLERETAGGVFASLGSVETLLGFEMKDNQLMDAAYSRDELDDSEPAVDGTAERNP